MNNNDVLNILLEYNIIPDQKCYICQANKLVDTLQAVVIVHKVVWEK